MVLLNREATAEFVYRITNRVQNDEIKGTTGYPGVVKGRCKIIKDFRKARINDGDILVTGMTDPNFVPLMQSAGAIVTDAGGMLCHAAIVSRELKKPCVIGTQIATQILHDGDLVEVDAGRGIVKIIKKAKKRAKGIV